MRTLLVAFLSVSGVALAHDSEPTPPADAAAVAAQLDECWKTRDAEASIKQCNDAIKDGNKYFATDYAILWKAARFRWWVADGTTDEKAKRQIAKGGWDYANRAVAANPTGAEGKYYVALNIGAYSQAVGILKALSEGLEGQFVENLDYAIKNNETFDRSGARTAKGRYHWELPWPKRDLKKSKDELQKSIDKHPEHLRNYYFLADTLLKDGDAKGAKATIEKALSGDESYDPPEARRIKAWAKVSAAAIAQELK
jgi:tetratricopeptide (TPR) repeat protein